MGYGAVIKKHRRMKGWTQDELGRKIGESDQVISNFEREVTPPNALALFRLAAALELSTDYIVGRTNDPLGVVNNKLDLYRVKDETEIFWENRKLSESEHMKIRKIITALLEEEEQLKNKTQTELNRESFRSP